MIDPETPMTTRAPGASACRAVATPRNSASPWTMVPASVTGEVAPAMGTVYTSTGAPRRAVAAWKSSSGPSMRSGDAAVSSVLNRGRSRNASASPETTSMMRSSGSACDGLSTRVTCLRASVSTT